MKLQGSRVFHPKTLQSQNCQRAENRLSLNGLEFVHGQPMNTRFGVRAKTRGEYSRCDGVAFAAACDNVSQAA
jgi:hypothetical protein